MRSIISVKSKQDQRLISVIKKTNVSRDDFEFWLFRMDDELDSFLDGFGSNIRIKFDFTLNSLLDLEILLLDRYPDVKSIRTPDESQNLDRYFRYVGETIRNVAGGVWTIELEDQKDAFYNIPILLSEKYGSCPPLSVVDPKNWTADFSAFPV